jgi:hypothetical protein
MRRESDRREGQRTGGGRRARDRILAGHSFAGSAIQSRYELRNLLLFLDDDLRESALAVGGIEGFLLRAQALLERPDLTPAQLEELVGSDDIAERMELLWDAISSLRSSMERIRACLGEQPAQASHP